MRGFLWILLLGVASAAPVTLFNNTCPDIVEFRSAAVKASYDPTKMTGLWYEHAYKDIAQVGATCQTLNATYIASASEVHKSPLPAAAIWLTLYIAQIVEHGFLGQVPGRSSIHNRGEVHACEGL